jgi:DNA-binding NtrC family response regulator
MKKRAKILVLDDSELIRELVRDVLERNGYEVVTSDSPFGFTNTLKSERPDLALVDVMMPGLSGDKLAEIAIRRGAACPIVLFSDRPPDLLASLATAIGAAGFIAKTADMDALALAVSRFLVDH